MVSWLLASLDEADDFESLLAGLLLSLAPALILPSQNHQMIF